MIYSDEKAMYPDIIKNIKYYLEFYGYTYKVFETWHEFKPELANKYQREINILGALGKPDIMVLYSRDGQPEKTLVIEVKKENVTLINIAQAKMYGDIFNADKVFLVAPYNLRTQIKQYYAFNNNILKYSQNRCIKYIKFEDGKLLLQNSFPEGGEVL